MNSISDTVDQNIVNVLSYNQFRPGQQVNAPPGQDPKMQQPGLPANTASSAPQPAAAPQQAEPVTKAERARYNQTKMGAKKKSWVWNWFVQDELDYNQAICDQCGKVVKRLASDKGSPKKLSEHLRVHRIDKDTINPNRDNVLPQRIDNNTVNVAIPSGTMYKKGVTGGYATLPRHILNEFEVRPYSQVKFHKELMKFLSENKLPISVVKSPTFRQIVFTLRPESIPDLDDLDNIYSSFVEVFKNTGTPPRGQSGQPPDEWL